MPEDRRTTPFTEKLSWLMAVVAALGGTYVILDPVVTFSLSWVEVKLGGEGFSEQLKGAVVALILIEGWKAVKEFWLGSSKQGQETAQAMNRIAENAPIVAANVVANASPSQSPISAATVNVEADTANISAPKDKP